MSKEDRLNRLQQLEILLARVVVMRDFQRAYFETRTRERLKEARLSEARVDVLIRELNDERYGLFG
jgi:hypothetical protein